MNDEEIDEFLRFINYADEQCKEKGKFYNFSCPICGKEAKAIKSGYNGHLWCECKNCDIKVIE